MKYPYARPEITLDDERNVLNVLKNGYLTQGDTLLEFEKELTKILKCKYVIVCKFWYSSHMVYSFIGLDKKCISYFTFVICSYIECCTYE